MNPLLQLPATTLQEMIRTREISPVDLVRASLERAHAVQPVLNCFITLCDDAAMKQAQEAENAIMRGESLGALHGIPFTVKDIVNTAGVRTTFGTVLHRDHVPEEDAISVARLKRAGGILLGKTTTPEFGSQPFTRSPLFGETRNAWSAERISGGSSGGAAVATAAGVTPLAVATDGGGSTRIPAACNGLVGIKQSLGVVPHSQAQDLFGNQTYVTPTTRTVADTGLMLQIMSGPSSIDPWSVNTGCRNYVGAARALGDFKGKRIRYNAAPENRPVSRDVQERFEESLALLESMGATLEPFDGQGFIVESIWRTVNHTVWRSRFLKLVEQHGQTFSDTFREQILSAESFSAADYQEAMFARARLYRELETLFDSADLLVTPTLTRSAISINDDLSSPLEIDGKRYEGLRSHWYPWTMVFNMTGHPAITLPCGFGKDGLPLGIQFATRFGSDEALLRYASLYEAGAPEHFRLPEIQL